MENNLSEVRVDDKVFHTTHGWGITTETIENSFRAVFTDRNNTLLSLWIYFDGRCKELDTNPSVFWDEVKIVPPPKPKIKVEKTIEGWVNIYPNDPVYCYKDVGARASHLYKSSELADENANKEKRLGEAYYIIHKYTIEE